MKSRTVITSILIAVLAVLMLIALLLINRSSIFQEGNPLPLMNAILHLQSKDTPYVQLSEQPETYLTKTQEFNDLFDHIEKTYNVRFSEHTEEGYCFRGDGSSLVLTARQYTRSYRIWELKSVG